jgi:hypothetical protein
MMRGAAAAEAETGLRVPHVRSSKPLPMPIAHPRKTTGAPREAPVVPSMVEAAATEPIR